jgi:DNA-directed RNA polymerase sigma subunit (sigma70/sigma32)
VTVRGSLSERELVLAAKECRGEARGALLEAFMPLIGNVARGYGGASGVGRAGVMQEGVVGLLRARERYDPRRVYVRVHGREPSCGSSRVRRALSARRWRA